MDVLRRTLLKAAGAGVSLGPLLAGLLTPNRVFAAEWLRPAFSATTLSEALKAYGGPASTEHRDIVISAPEIAENGAQVPVEITSNIPGSQTLAVFIEKNPLPLATSLGFANGALPYVRLQLKIAESGRLRVVVQAADGKAYHASREIKVTLGGCAA